jgi:phenylalanine-4-hydroxylase
LRIYGAGIVSSYGESIFCLDDPSPNRIRFDLLRLMRTEYRIDDFQQNYFVIPSLSICSRSRSKPISPALCQLGNAARYSRLPTSAR